MSDVCKNERLEKVLFVVMRTFSVNVVGTELMKKEEQGLTILPHSFRILARNFLQICE